MKRSVAALAVVVSLAAVNAARADWGAMPTASGMSVKDALGPGYGPPPGVSQASSSEPLPPGAPHPTLMSYASAPNDRPPNKYGWHPSLKKLMFWKKDDCGGGCGSGCGNGSCGGGSPYGAPAHGVNMGPANPQQGTLVFPHHTYIRGPRDYFMAGN